MTHAARMKEQGWPALIAQLGVSLSYQERGGSAQTATGIAQNYKPRGSYATQDFVFLDGDLTISDWQGAKILIGGDSTKPFTVEGYGQVPGAHVFSGRIPLERA